MSKEGGYDRGGWVLYEAVSTQWLGESPGFISARKFKNKELNDMFELIEHVKLRFTDRFCEFGSAGLDVRGSAAKNSVPNGVICKNRLRYSRERALQGHIVVFCVSPGFIILEIRVLILQPVCCQMRSAAEPAAHLALCSVQPAAQAETRPSRLQSAP